MGAVGSECFDSPQQLRPMDLRGRLWPTTAHLAKRAGDLRGSHSIHAQSFSGSPRLNQSPAQSNESVLPQPKSSKSAWLHHPCAQNLVAKLNPCHMSHRWCSKLPALGKECCIVPLYCLRQQPHCHHSGEALYDRSDRRLQKPGCMPVLHPKVGCCIVQIHCLRQQPHCHHSGEALYASRLQKSGCMPVLHPKVGCCIVQIHCLRWQKHCHRSGETLYDTLLQKSVRIPVLHPKVGCCIVQIPCLRWQKHYHRSGEALYASRLQKSGCMPVLHPKVGCCIVQMHCLRQQPHCHYSGEALYDTLLQKSVCIPVLHPKVGCCIVQIHWLRWQKHYHRSGEALYDRRLKKSGCMPVLHPKVGCCIVQIHCLRWQQHCHRSGEASCDGWHLEKPLLESSRIWSEQVWCVGDRHAAMPNMREWVGIGQNLAPRNGLLTKGMGEIDISLDLIFWPNANCSTKFDGLTTVALALKHFAHLWCPWNSLRWSCRTSEHVQGVFKSFTWIMMCCLFITSWQPEFV